MFDIMIITLRPMSPQQVQDSNSLTTMMLGVPGPGFTYSERDCLNLNVFAPRCVEYAPVICYIHGGRYGGNALPKNDATNIVKQSIVKGTPVVVVTVNYRIPPSAGLLESPKEQATPSDEDGADGAVNWGVYDQKLALEWIRKHIHNFGGNPQEITLMGHSNGSSSAGYHLLTARHEGLFKRAIMHSESKDKASDCATKGEARGQEKIISYMSVDMEQQTSHGQRPTSSRLVPLVNGGGGEHDVDENVPFTFMSDACTPYMTEREKQAGVRVIDRWIDFAYGHDGNVDASTARQNGSN
ncbi:MAG: Carboxylesterase family-domain-containing protein [Benniella sp.]|nr:MAG: Carboxylesterase family-domain-containing protein [Benniella sp.]